MAQQKNYRNAGDVLANYEGALDEYWSRGLFGTLLAKKGIKFSLEGNDSLSTIDNIISDAENRIAVGKRGILFDKSMQKWEYKSMEADRYFGPAAALLEDREAILAIEMGSAANKGYANRLDALAQNLVRAYASKGVEHIADEAIGRSDAYSVFYEPAERIAKEHKVDLAHLKDLGKEIVGLTFLDRYDYLARVHLHESSGPIMRRFVHKQVWTDAGNIIPFVSVSQIAQDAVELYGISPREVNGLHDRALSAVAMAYRLETESIRDPLESLRTLEHPTGALRQLTERINSQSAGESK